MKKVGDVLKANNTNWEFSSKVADNFDSHARKSIPNYTEEHKLITNLSDFFITSNSICNETGCSTASLTYKLAYHTFDKTGSRFLGIDIENEMIQVARQKAEPLQENIEFVEDEILQAELEPSSSL